MLQKGHKKYEYTPLPRPPSFLKKACFLRAFLKKNIFFERLSCFRLKKYVYDPKQVASLPALPPQAFLFIAQPLQACFWHAFLCKNIFCRPSCFRIKDYVNKLKQVANLSEPKFATGPTPPQQACLFLTQPLQACIWHTFLCKYILFWRLSCFR